MMYSNRISEAAVLNLWDSEWMRVRNSDSITDFFHVGLLNSETADQFYQLSIAV